MFKNAVKTILLQTEKEHNSIFVTQKLLFNKILSLSISLNYAEAVEMLKIDKMFIFKIIVCNVNVICV